MGIHPTIEIATVSMWDTMILMIMALVVFGPRRLPKIGRQIGKLMYEFRKASNDFRFQMEEEMRMAEEADRRKREEQERQRALTAAPVAQIAAPAAEPAEAPPATAGRAEEYLAGSEPESSYSYDDAAYEHYQQQPPAAEVSPEPTGLRVQPPVTGEPVPAASPTSRAAALPAAPAEPAQEFLPSGDEAALSHPEAVRAESPAPENPYIREAGVETEPAAHHG